MPSCDHVILSCDNVMLDPPSRPTPNRADPPGHAHQQWRCRCDSLRRPDFVALGLKTYDLDPRYVQLNQQNISFLTGGKTKEINRPRLSVSGLWHGIFTPVSDCVLLLLINWSQRLIVTNTEQHNSAARIIRIVFNYRWVPFLSGHG